MAIYLIHPGPMYLALTLSLFQRCISELKDRVARGGDPTLLHEPPVEEAMPEGEPGLSSFVLFTVHTCKALCI
jgi:hypothetical protein